MADVATTRREQARNERALQQMTANLSTVVREGMASTRLSLPRVGIELTSLMKQTLSTPGRGRLYRGKRAPGGRDYQGRFVSKEVAAQGHRASAPGDPPAPDTGQYRNSWSYATGPGYVEIGTPQERGPALEFGSSTIEPRPHVRPTVAGYAKVLPVRIAEAITPAQKAAIAKLKPPA